MIRIPLTLIALAILGCAPVPPPVSTSGVSKATATVRVGSDGLTTEQRNIQHRTEQDNAPGTIQHLYVISAYSGQVLIYSTVQGKITSSGKRLTPSHLSNGGTIFTESTVRNADGTSSYLFTDEMIGDDGTYGSSEPYLFWYDSSGIYHQHYVSGGQIIHISSQPLAVKSVTINMEETVAPAQPAVTP